MKNTTNEQLEKRQNEIQNQLMVEVPKLKELKTQALELELRICQARTEFREISRELHIRTKGVTKLGVPKTKKRKPLSETTKRIKRLVKEIGSEEVKRLLGELEK